MGTRSKPSWASPKFVFWRRDFSRAVGGRARMLGKLVKGKALFLAVLHMVGARANERKSLQDQYHFPWHSVSNLLSEGLHWKEQTQWRRRHDHRTRTRSLVWSQKRMEDPWIPRKPNKSLSFSNLVIRFGPKWFDFLELNLSFFRANPPRMDKFGLHESLDFMFWVWGLLIVIWLGHCSNNHWISRDLPDRNLAWFPHFYCWDTQIRTFVSCWGGYIVLIRR